VRFLLLVELVSLSSHAMVTEPVWSLFVVYYE
jgi:hypothetical protein